MIPWTEKYRPKSLSDVQGNNKDLREIKSWAEGFLPGDSAILLVGDPGVGKTSTAQALANEMDWTINEINASSARTTVDMQRIASEIASQPPSGERQLILLDEVDSLSRKSSIKPLEEALENPPNPIIAIANEEWKVPNSITKQCEKYEFKLGKASIKSKLKKIAEKEDLDLSAKQLGKLATRGNLRAAIQDLQQYALTGELDWDQRRLEADNFDTVDGFLNADSYVNVTMGSRELVEWLNENLSVDYRGLELGMAHEALAMADRWNNLAFSEGRFKLLKYAYPLAEMTKDFRLTEPYDGWFNKSYPSQFRHNTPKPEGDSGEAILYRKLKGYDSGEFGFQGDFTYFRKVVLPILKNLPERKKFELILNESLSKETKVFNALDISKTDYREWLENSEKSERNQNGIGNW